MYTGTAILPGFVGSWELRHLGMENPGTRWMRIPGSHFVSNYPEEGPTIGTVNCPWKTILGVVLPFSGPSQASLLTPPPAGFLLGQEWPPSAHLLPVSSLLLHLPCPHFLCISLLQTRRHPFPVTTPPTNDFKQGKENVILSTFLCLHPQYLV